MWREPVTSPSLSLHEFVESNLNRGQAYDNAAVMAGQHTRLAFRDASRKLMFVILVHLKDDGEVGGPAIVWSLTSEDTGSQLFVILVHLKDDGEVGGPAIVWSLTSEDTGSQLFVILVHLKDDGEVGGPAIVWSLTSEDTGSQLCNGCLDGQQNVLGGTTVCILPGDGACHSPCES